MHFQLLIFKVYYCKTHNYLILLNRQRINSYTSMTKSPWPSFRPVNPPTSSQPSPKTSNKALLRGRPLVLSSSEDLLTAFLFFYARIPAALICWTLGQQAFNSCMILLLDATETGNLGRIWKVEKAYAVFKELENNGVHKLASLAVERISWGLEKLRKMKDQIDRGIVGAGNIRAAPVTSFRRGEIQGCDTAMRTASGSEAILGSGQMHDTVMGNTGMLLLEDPGLQSFVAEAFTPMTWAIAGVDRGDAASTPLKQNKESWHQGEENQSDDTKPMISTESVRDSRSAGGVQGSHGSAPGSAPIRYATFLTAPSQEQPQPQGLTSPTSPPTESMLMQAQNERCQHLQGTSTNTHQSLPSHAILRDSRGHKRSVETQWGSNLNAGSERQQQQDHLQGTSIGPYQFAAPHLRHHSCPSLNQGVHVPTPLVPHPPYSSAKHRNLHPSMRSKKTPTAPGFGTSPSHVLPGFIRQPIHQAGNPSVHPS